MFNRNGMRTVFLMTLVAVLFMLVGQVLGGSTGLVIAFIFAMGMNAVSYWYSDKMVLKMYRAEEVDQQSHPKLYNMVKELAQKADLPMPKVYVIPQQQPNAFATGRNPEHSAVAFTQGILKVLDHDQLKGVTAHELAHIKNRDILTQTIVTTVVSALSMLAQFAFFLPIGGGDRDGPNPLVAILVLITAPIAASLLQAAISRTREYEADRVGAEISGEPQSLAVALQRIEQAVEQVPMQVSETAMRSTSHMFPVNPFKGGKFMSLFSTHPDTEDRVNRLMHMAQTGEYDFN
ncbi:zinc metalloprotease HtpX [Aliifodinibius sp. S!AR15-10]|uniref:zinc metalloprotease HtpX n=1 Tax=Aliifodinibius sp. S!AR15-10 TaxID=2950437 RepID=UPI002864C1EE|nr:zinc metalloprotease HtpX [Aliifodinibius sp. S!AR15-10]MDR8391336.1 zinc metalloprotease HtpX [Aliifodinibius sp. S!AR15-10]